MPQFRYRPKDNRTPVNHPVLGHLDYDTVVEADSTPGPDFEPVRPPRNEQADKPAAHKSTATEVKPAAKQPGAGKTGGSKS